MPRLPNIKGALNTTLGTCLERAQAMAQIGKMAYFWDDFDYETAAAALPKWVQIQSGTGNYAAGGGDNIGWWMTLASGATAASTVQPGGGNPFITNSTTKKWYIAARFAVATAIDAQAVVGCGFDDSTNSVMMGVTGSLSTVNFVIQHSGLRGGTALSYGVAIDTSTHIFEAWGVGTTAIAGRIDGGAVVSGTQSVAVATNPYQRMYVGNGTTAANRAMHIDWFFNATERSG